MRITRDTAAVVTGGASGLGHATARALSEAGARVAIFDRDGEKGEAVAHELGGVFCQVDVTSEDQILAGFERARSVHGQERILVNCAGIGIAAKTAGRDKAGGINRHPIADFQRVIDINLIGTFRCISIAAAGMLAIDPLDDGERGAIVNTASVAAQDGQIGQAAYSASKAAISGMTLTIARDLASEGVRVNTILPDIFATPLLMALPEPVRDALGASVPFPKRLGRPEEFASLALELVRNGYFNGQSIRLDGAIRMAPR